jgi:hypothetical protein
VAGTLAAPKARAPSSKNANFNPGADKVEVFHPVNISGRKGLEVRLQAEPVEGSRSLESDLQAFSPPQSRNIHRMKFFALPAFIEFQVISFTRLPDPLPPRSGAVNLARRFNAG